MRGEETQTSPSVIVVVVVAVAAVAAVVVVVVANLVGKHWSREENQNDWCKC